MRSERSLRKASDFARVRAEGRVMHAPAVRIYTRRRDDGAPARLGIAVGRRAGRAVARNRIKRRLRAAFEAAGERTGIDVVAHGSERTLYASFQELVDAFRRGTS
jgi:ribonuclease P protein component